ncbi:hypothetical protein BDFG_00870 [Blastomyces dermatitidis ATCC 26199]|nr:hypothetical protein BDFG_00870 [Blastomyces dermatitidis ATCC 26199]
MVGAEFDEKRLSRYDTATLVSHIVESCKLSWSVFLLSQNLVAKHFSRGKEVNVLAAMARAGRLWDQGALHQTDGREGQRSLHHPGADSWTDFGGSLDAPWLAYSSGSGISASPVRASDERGDVFHCRISLHWDASGVLAGGFLSASLPCLSRSYSSVHPFLS